MTLCEWSRKRRMAALVAALVCFGMYFSLSWSLSGGKLIWDERADLLLWRSGTDEFGAGRADFRSPQLDSGEPGRKAEKMRHQGSGIIPSKQEEISRSKGKTQAATPSPSLLLFTTWAWNPEKDEVERSVLVTWPRWRPHVQPLLFSDNRTTQQRALQHGWHVLPVPRKACGGLPVLAAMFQSAMERYENSFYGFSNADLLFDDSLNTSIQAILQNKQPLYDLNNTMVLSKRINVKWPKGLVLNDTTRLREFAAKGHYPPEGSSDLFITTSSFPWKDVPDLVVGRIAFGMWMVAFARARRVHTIDITRTCRIVHMTTKSGNIESHTKPNKTCNFDTIKASGMKANFNCGWIDCSQFVADAKNAGEISIVPHELTRGLCLPCTSEDLQ